MADDGAESIDAEGPNERAKDQATPAECTLTTEIASEEAADSFNPFDEVNESVDLGPLPVVIAADGMPTIGPIDPDYAPPLSPENMVCMGDTSKFVVRDSFGYIQAEFPPDRVERTPSGFYVTTLVEADWDKEDRLRAAGIKRCACGDRIPVEPIRPKCQHYVRKQMPMEEAHDHRYVYRLCSARRTTEGTFMSVGNTAVWACSMREPRDMVSEKILDDFDALKVQEGRNRTYHSIFDAKESRTPEGVSTTDAESLIKNAGLGSLGSNK
jgi:hypothetical protein